MRLYFWCAHVAINPWQNTTLIKDHPDVRPAWLQTTLIKDHPDERPAWLQTTLIKDHPKRPSWWETSLVTDHPDQRPSQETIRMRDHPYQRPSKIRLTEKVLHYNKSGVGHVTVDKKNLTDTCNKHRGKCCNKGKWKYTPNLLFIKSLNRPEPCTQHHVHVPKMNSAADGMLADPIFVYCGTW